MTSTDDRRDRSRSYTPPQGAPVPQPVFVNQPDVSRFLSPTGLDDPLEYEDWVPAAPDVHRHNMQPGPSHPAPQPHAGDVFSAEGLGVPAVPDVRHHNMQPGPSHPAPLPHAGDVVTSQHCFEV
jgi:hypothetical protein